MNFHPGDKCKAVTIKHNPSLLAMLSLVTYLAENLLSYADSEWYLGQIKVII